MLESSTLQWSSWCKDDVILPPQSPINKVVSELSQGISPVKYVKKLTSVRNMEQALSTSHNNDPVLLDVKMCALRDSTLPYLQNHLISNASYTNCEPTPGNIVESSGLNDVEHLESRTGTASPDFPMERSAQHIITPSQMHELYLFNGAPELAGDVTYQSHGDSNHALYSYQRSANDNIWNTGIQNITVSSVSTSLPTSFAFDCFSNHDFPFDEPPQAYTQQQEPRKDTVSFGSTWSAPELSSDPVNFETTSGSFIADTSTSDGRYTFIDAPQEARIRRDTARRRDMEDRFLLRSRAAGMSFKTIKEQGRFNVAESTLRGRYRALTKDKRDREREPKWTDEDIKALHSAFEREKTDHGDNFRWTRVAEIMSYPYTTRNFAAQTCSKKWREIRKS